MGSVTSLEVRDLAKSFGPQPVLAGIDLSVPAGSLTAILGPSGSGKTTLLRIVAGFERADRGTVELGGQLVEGPGVQVPAEQRHIGYVPQEGNLFPHLNVARNVAFGLPRAERRGAKVGELLEMVGLAGLGGRYPHELSGGQQQRVALARALAIAPRVVLLDEPFSSLDAGLRASVRHDVHRVLREAGTTALLVTHDQDEALSLADLVAVIRQGRIDQVDTPERLYRRPQDPAVARFVGEANLLAGQRGPEGVTTALGRHPLTSAPPSGPADAPVLVLVRPEQLELAADPPAGATAGRVEEVEFYGHDAVVRVRPEADCGTPLLEARTTDGRLWPLGTRVALHVRGAVRAFPADPVSGGAAPVGAVVGVPGAPEAGAAAPTPEH